jgi:DNA primase large subunit
MIEFRANPDAWKYGNQSHFMEFAIMTQAAKVGASFDVVCEFFSEMPDYDENWTKYQYAQVVRRGYKSPHHDTMWKKAPEFMTPEACPHCAKTMPRTPAF